MLCVSSWLCSQSLVTSSYGHSLTDPTVLRPGGAVRSAMCWALPWELQRLHISKPDWTHPPKQNSTSPLWRWKAEMRKEAGTDCLTWEGWSGQLTPQRAGMGKQVAGTQDCFPGPRNLLLWVIISFRCTPFRGSCIGESLNKDCLTLWQQVTHQMPAYWNFGFEEELNLLVSWFRMSVLGFLHLYVHTDR